MNAIDPNFLYLQQQWFAGMAAEEAFNNFHKWCNCKLARILRHHNDTEEGISDRETWQRDKFDYLLGYYTIIEIATMIGFFKDIPLAFRNAHLPVLCDSSVRRYYESNYTLDMPRRLRERIQCGVGYTIPKSPELNAAFLEFLELTKFIERDTDMESFLWALDGGWRKDKSGVCDIDRVKKSLAKPERFARALHRPPTKRGEIDRALNGFYKFIQFSESLSDLIDRLKKTPELAEAMWLAHAYWFRRLDSTFGVELRLAIRSLAQWKVKSADIIPMKKRIIAIEGVFHKLSSPPMSNRGDRAVRRPAPIILNDCAPRMRSFRNECG